MLLVVFIQMPFNFLISNSSQKDCTFYNTITLLFVAISDELDNTFSVI